MTLNYDPYENEFVGITASNNPELIRLTIEGFSKPKNDTMRIYIEEKIAEVKKSLI